MRVNKEQCYIINDFNIKNQDEVSALFEKVLDERNIITFDTDDYLYTFLMYHIRCEDLSYNNFYLKINSNWYYVVWDIDKNDDCDDDNDKMNKFTFTKILEDIELLSEYKFLLTDNELEKVKKVLTFID